MNRAAESLQKARDVTYVAPERAFTPKLLVGDTIAAIIEEVAAARVGRVDA